LVGPLSSLGVFLTTLSQPLPAPGAQPAPLPEDFFKGASGLRATFAPAGKVLAVSGEFHCNTSPAGLLLWDLEAERQEFVLDKDLILVYAFAFSPDGKRFATGHREGAVRLWDAATCKKLADLGEHGARVLSAAFSPDGSLLATTGGDHKVILWDVKKRKGRIILSLPPDAIAEAMAFSPDGKALALAATDGTIRLTDVRTGKQVGSIGDGEEDCSCAVAFSPDGETLACGKTPSGDAQEVMLWDIRARKEKVVLKGREGVVTYVAFSPDGRLLASAWSHGGIKVWDLPAGKERFTINSRSVSSLFFFPDGRILAGTVEYHQVKLWDTATGKEVRAKGEE
jgi:WD40 repeat protein